MVVVSRKGFRAARRASAAHKDRQLDAGAASFIATESGKILCPRRKQQFARITSICGVESSITASSTPIGSAASPPLSASPTMIRNKFGSPGVSRRPRRIPPPARASPAALQIPRRACAEGRARRRHALHRRTLPSLLRIAQQRLAKAGAGTGSVPCAHCTGSAAHIQRPKNPAVHLEPRPPPHTQCPRWCRHRAHFVKGATCSTGIAMRMAASASPSK